MSKASKSCKYTGRMHIAERVNTTKETYETRITRSHGLHGVDIEQHPHHKVAYPEEKAQCTCTQK